DEGHRMLVRELFHEFVGFVHDHELPDKRTRLEVIHLCRMGNHDIIIRDTTFNENPARITQGKNRLAEN
ncbi:MAG: hypothetical protein WC262_10780, partial [Bacteroidales bacterium]